MFKADYVKGERQSRDHICHWPGCGAQVPPAMWGCSRHWFALPITLRREIWRTFVPGQEKTFSPSPAYLKAAKAVQDWINQNAKS